MVVPLAVIMDGKRKYHLPPRGIKLWNSQPVDIVISFSIDGFKRGLERLMEDRF